MLKLQDGEDNTLSTEFIFQPTLENRSVPFYFLLVNGYDLRDQMFF